jgi:predicted O-methyltransferase YrrM
MIRARDERRLADIKRRVTTQEQTRDGRPAQFSYQAAIEFHTARGLAFHHVRDGSIPEASLQYCSKVFDEQAPTAGPLIGLHVGNFVGVSLCHFLDYVKRQSPDSVIVSIDPNLSHRGIARPQEHAITLANYFGLQDNLVVCVGYSCEKSISNDGKSFADAAGKDYDPFAAFGEEVACEQQLLNLSRTSANQFDFAVLDGNHDGNYLGREVELIRKLLKPAGLLILDDVTGSWEDIKQKFVELQSKGWQPLGTDGRVGILRWGDAS